MKRRLSNFRLVCVIAGLCTALQGCQNDPHSRAIVAAGTETNWLKSCSNDQECGALECECGVCTQRCDQESECSQSGAICGAASGRAVATLCASSESTFGLCLPSCDNTCATGQSCMDGACVPLHAPTSGGDSALSDDTTGDSDGFESTQTTTTTVLDAGGSAQETNEDPGSNSASLVGTPGDASGVSTDASTMDADVSFIDATSGCPLDTRPLTAGCCYVDEDCADGQQCYQAACSGDVLAPGRCAAAPAAPNCYSDRDCGDGEVCQDGKLASCGTLGPDALGACIVDCEFDSCHPDRCDEVGEPCCDPLPGDGPGYCNAELVCGASGCEEMAETTTPEELAQQNCANTQGTWNAMSCGHYVCGEAPACAAIVPGCDCGANRSFSTNGCFDDSSCGVQ
jgi:hypothetical protein